MDTRHSQSILVEAARVGYMTSGRRFISGCMKSESKASHASSTYERSLLCGWKDVPKKVHLLRENCHFPPAHWSIDSVSPQCHEEQQVKCPRALLSSHG